MGFIPYKTQKSRRIYASALLIYVPETDFSRVCRAIAVISSSLFWFLKLPQTAHLPTGPGAWK
jgi:hypothetical protein